MTITSSEYFFIVGLLLIFTTSFSKTSQLNVSLISNTLSKLKYAVNNKDFPSLSNFLAVDYLYENMKVPSFAGNIGYGLLGYPFLSYQKTAINFKDNELYFLE